MQFLEAETKLVHIIHLKTFLFKLDNVLLLKYMCIYFESQFITHYVKPGFVTSVVYAALLRILFMSVEVLFSSV
jgi:hypothetical protein